VIDRAQESTLATMRRSPVWLAALAALAIPAHAARGATTVEPYPESPRPRSDAVVTGKVEGTPVRLKSFRSGPVNIAIDGLSVDWQGHESAWGGISH
jgi:hypothetical protein